jgi:hypothetical protein
MSGGRRILRHYLLPLLVLLTSAYWSACQSAARRQHLHDAVTENSLEERMTEVRSLEEEVLLLRELVKDVRREWDASGIDERWRKRRDEVRHQSYSPKDRMSDIDCRLRLLRNEERLLTAEVRLYQEFLTTESTPWWPEGPRLQTQELDPPPATRGADR